MYKPICYRCLSQQHGNSEDDEAWEHVFEKFWRKGRIPCPKGEIIDTEIAQQTTGIYSKYFDRRSVRFTKTTRNHIPEKCALFLENFIAEQSSENN